MSEYLIPTTNHLIESVARSMAHSALLDSAIQHLYETGNQDQEDQVRESFDDVFAKLWESTLPGDIEEQNRFRTMAHTAISAINLSLILG